MDKPAIEQLAAYLDQQASPMLESLGDLVNVESHASAPVGVNAGGCGRRG